MSSTVQWRWATYSGHRISYCVSGTGPPLVLVKPHREPRVYDAVPWLAARYTVIQIEPLGYGRSDRPSRHPDGRFHEQVHAVLGQEAVDRFVVWGYSAGGAMALLVAHGSPRVTAVVCGGWSPAERLSDARLRRMDREQRTPASQRTFWHEHSSIHWLDALATTTIPTLAYVGTDDGPRTRGPRGIPRTRDALTAIGVTVLELEGLNHSTCMEEPAFSSRVGPRVVEWLDEIVHRA